VATKAHVNAPVSIARLINMDLMLRGKRAFITGGTHGIGLAIALALITYGASVSVCGRDHGRLRHAVTQLSRGGRRAHGIVADVTDAAALGRAVDESAEELGGLDLLVANAGGSSGGDLLDSTPEEWATTFQLNVLHAAHAIRTAVPHLEKSGGGSALIIASISGRKPGTKSSYSTAKAAEIHLAAVLAEELATRRIRVNALSPGAVLFEGGRWGRTQSDHPERFETFARENFPSGRLVTLDEVADTACFLLSERSSGINGADIRVDGGQDRSTDRRFYP
jgi:3-oxoacyl-[acyl-carrier protein] reductase